MRTVVTFLAILCLAALTGAAFAMDPGTYRPGQPYHSSKSDSAYACSAQCQSDSQCQGWNFVTVKRGAKFGICEYNARRAAPVSSPVSVSGDSIAANRTSTQLISGGSRTLRVGSQPSAQPRFSRVPQNTSRQVISQPTAQHPTQQAVHRPAPTRRPLHALDTLPQRAAPQPAPRPVTTPRFQHSLEATQPMNSQSQRAPVQRPQMRAPQRPAYAPQANPRPVAATRAQPTRLPLPKVEARPMENRPMARAPIQTRNSLYGSLHDDVIVPKPLTPADIPLDPNAPIPTVRSVPTQKVMKDRLYGMAGPNR